MFSPPNVKSSVSRRLRLNLLKIVFSLEAMFRTLRKDFFPTNVLRCPEHFNAKCRKTLQQIVENLYGKLIIVTDRLTILFVFYQITTNLLV